MECSYVNSVLKSQLISMFERYKTMVIDGHASISVDYLKGKQDAYKEMIEIIEISERFYRSEYKISREDVVDSFKKLLMTYGNKDDYICRMKDFLDKALCFKYERNDDIFSSFISGVYDGFVYNNFWIDKITIELMMKISFLLCELINNENLTYGDVDRALCELDEMGLYITSY